MQPLVESLWAYVLAAPFAAAAATGLAFAIRLWRADAARGRRLLFGSLLMVAAFVLTPLPAAVVMSAGPDGAMAATAIQLSVNTVLGVGVIVAIAAAAMRPNASKN